MKKLAAISIVLFLLSPATYGGCVWVTMDDGHRERVCTPDYYQVLTTEPDWSLYTQNDVVFAQLGPSGVWARQAWYVVPVGQPVGTLPSTFGPVIETCYVSGLYELQCIN